MEIILYLTGKQSKNYIAEGENIFTSRINHYCKFKVVYFQIKKNRKAQSEKFLKHEEAKLFLSSISNQDCVILLDENGIQMKSRSFAAWLQTKLNYSYKRIIFIVGGAYGFDSELYDRADGKISLSQMTFPHQLIRLIFTEQLYRAFTILKNEKYHND